MGRIIRNVIDVDGHLMIGQRAHVRVVWPINYKIKVVKVKLRQKEVEMVE